MGQIPYFRRSKEEQNTIFSYDLKSTSKHFIAGTLVINNVDDLVRYDDFTLIRQKKGLQIKSLSIYRAQNKIVGYEIIYKDAGNSKLRFRRIASNFNSFGNKVSVTGIKLEYNEHLSNFEVIYTQDEIKYVEIRTSKDKILKVGMQVEGGYSSFNKIDITQKNFAPIIALETTFSNDCLKEIFIYRCPVRITKKKQRRKLTVSEINNMKVAPSYETVRRARHHLDVMREFTKKGMAQLRIVRGWQGLAQQAKQASNASVGPAVSNNSPHFKAYIEQNKTQEAYMQEQEYGAADEDEEEGVEGKKDMTQSALMRASQKIRTVFARKSMHSATTAQEKGQSVKEGSPASQNKKSKGTLFSWRPSLGRRSQKDESSSKGPLSTDTKTLVFTKDKATSQNDLDDTPKQTTKQEKQESIRKGRKSFSAFGSSQFDFKGFLPNFRSKQRTSIEPSEKSQKRMSFNIFSKTRVNPIGTEKTENINV